MSVLAATVNEPGTTLRVYFDHNATTPLDPQVRAVMNRVLVVNGNPSSIHAEGREARDLVEVSRRQVAALIDAAPEEIVFTSGGTEANGLGIIGLARLGHAQGQPPRVLVAAVEHPAVFGAAEALAAQGFAVESLPVDNRGRLRLDALAQACEQGQGAAVLAVALANHELGTVQDLAAITTVAEQYGIPVHCDAVQAAGKMPLAVADLGVASVAISAHKFYGPKGVGALWMRRDLDLAPLWGGGHQERGRRPGTENVLGIAGMGEAARCARAHVEQWSAHVRDLTAQLEAGLVAMDGVRIHGRDAARIGNTVNAGFAGALGESVVAALDLAGFAVATGAACSSGTVAPSPVLLGLGLAPERAVEAVRFSLGRDNTAAEVAALLAVLPEIIGRARQFR